MLTTVQKKKTLANGANGQLVLRIPYTAYLRAFVVEPDANINSNNEYHVFALRTVAKTDAIGNGLTPGTILFDIQTATISTNGAFVCNTRHVYDLFGVFVESDGGKVYAHIKNGSGAEVNYIAKLIYSDVPLN